MTCDMRKAGRWLHLLALFALLFAGVRLAVAGALPMPLEAHLDLAQSVVLGKITTMQDITANEQASVREGRATIAVSRVLKGSPAKTIEVTCVTRVTPAYQGPTAIREYQVGDSGIWVINADGTLSGYYGLLPEQRQSEVAEMLQRLAERQWSKPVNGLKAWAAVVSPDYSTSPVVIFAVQNVTEANMFLPSELTSGFITATATTDEKQYHYELSPGGRTNDAVFCRRLLPGEIRYLHPAYSFIVLKGQELLPDRKYAVVVSCRNTQHMGTIARSASVRDPVAAWVGELSAPPIELVIAPPAKK